MEAPQIAALSLKVPQMLWILNFTANLRHNVFSMSINQAIRQNEMSSVCENLPYNPHYPLQVSFSHRFCTVPLFLFHTNTCSKFYANFNVLCRNTFTLRSGLALIVYILESHCSNFAPLIIIICIITKPIIHCVWNDTCH